MFFFHSFKSLNLNELAAQAAQAVDKKDFEPAEKLYRKILKIDSGQIDAALGLSQLLIKLKRPAEALALMSRAEYVAQHDPRWLETFAALLLSQTQSNRAETICRYWIATQPENPRAYNHLALSLMMQARYAEAEDLLNGAFARFDGQNRIAIGLKLGSLALKRGNHVQAEQVSSQLMEVHGDQFEVIELRIRCLIARNELDKASALATTWIHAHPHHAAGFALFSHIALLESKVAEALRAAEQAIALDATNLHGQLVLALAQNNSGAYEAALEQLETLLTHHPEYADAHYQIGRFFLKSNDSDDARFHFEICLRLDPLHADAGLALACLIKKSEHSAAAISLAEAVKARIVFHHGLFEFLAMEHYRETSNFAYAANLDQHILREHPSNVDAMSRLGLTLRAMGAYQEAYKILLRASALNPTHQSVLHNLALVKADLGHITEALNGLTQLADLQPDDAEVQWDLTLLRLSAGDYAAGWDNYELRWRMPLATTLPTDYPKWSGQVLPHGTLLVLGEQGIGDEIMFGSCIHELRGYAKRIIIGCNTKLVALFRRSFNSFGEVVDRNKIEEYLAPPSTVMNPPADIVQIASGSLPKWYRRHRGDFPLRAHFLHADPARIAFWRKRLSTDNKKLHIGLSWRGGAAATQQSLRSLGTDDLKQLTQFAEACFVNLQYDATAGEIATLKQEHGIELLHFDEALADYDETAALTCAVDVVVTVQTALAHLAGALGQRVLVMLPFSPEWRYLRSGSEWPWYPSATLLRQTTPGVWQDVIETVHAKLGKL